MKLSVALKDYEERPKGDPVLEYFSEGLIYKKIEDIKMLIRVLGDVEFEDDVYMMFLYKVGQTKIGRFGMSDVDAYRKFKTIYDLIKDSKISSKLVGTLFDYYHGGAFELFKDDIKFSIDYLGIDGRDEFGKMLKSFVDKAKVIAKEDALRLEEELKDEYDPKFISELQEIVSRRCIPYEKVMSILPTKEFIDSSTTTVPVLGYQIISGADLVKRRLIGFVSDDEFEQTGMDSPIKLGICSSGDYVYTSFTKRQYLDSISIEKAKLLEKRKD